MSDPMPSWEELKRRKIVQWGLAYLAGAWVVLQLVDVLGGPFGWSAGLTRGVAILLAAGFFVTLVLAWYHGEQGQQRVSGPELLMVTALLVVAGAAIAIASGSADTAAPEEPGEAMALPATGADSIPSRSIAVLPLDDHSPDPEDAYFAGAMTEAITNALQKVPALRVTSRNSAAKFTDSEKTLGEFARAELGVAHVIEGSVQLQDGTALVTVQLIDTATEDHLWSETYEVELIDVIGVQVDIARQVAERLATTLSERAAERIRSGSTDDPRAYDLYLRATDAGKETLDDLDRRISLLQEAVRRDSAFALAHFMLGDAYYQMAVRGDPSRYDSAFVQLDRAIDAARDSLFVDFLKAFRHWAVEQNPEKAIDMMLPIARQSPSDLRAASFLAASYGSTGDLDEALVWGRKAVALDPLDPRYRTGQGRMFTHLGLDSLARRELEKGIELGSERARGFLFDLHLLRGEFSAADTVVDSVRSLGSPWADIYEVRLHAWSGDMPAARAAIARISEEALRDRGWTDAPTVAHILLLAGDTAQAEALLDEAEAIRVLPTDIYSGTGLKLRIAAVRGDAEAAERLLREATEIGWRRARLVPADPVFSRVRDAPGFQAALAELERIVAEQRAAALRDLRDGD